MAEELVIKELLYYGNASEVPSPEKRPDTALYFVEDQNIIYRGKSTVPYGGAIKPINGSVSIETVASPAQGILYIGSDRVAKIYNGTDFVIIAKPSVTAVNADSTDDETPTAAAVYKAITKAVEDFAGSDGVINNVTSTVAGTITVSKGEVNTETKVAGAVFNPTYEAESRTITLPYNKVDTETGNITTESLVIALGKDSVVTSGSYNKETKNIELVLTTGETVSVPAEDLVDVFTGGTTNTTTVSVSDTNEITVDVNISTKAGNALHTETGEGEVGLYVADHTNDITTLQANVTALSNALKWKTFAALNEELNASE